MPLGRALGLSLAALLVCSALSCHSHRGPPPPDYGPQQRALWGLAPADTVAGLAAVDLGHLLSRLDAGRIAATTGPIFRKYITQRLTDLGKTLGFEPLDPASWRRQGIDPSGPLALFVLPSGEALLLVRAVDAGRAQAFLERLLERLGLAEGAGSVRCAPFRLGLLCAKGETAGAASEAASLWPRLEGEVPAADRSGEVTGFLALDRGPGRQVRASSNPLGQARSLFGAVTLTDDQILFRLSCADAQAATLRAFLGGGGKASTLLGLGAEAQALGRLRLVPEKLWALAQDLLGPTLVGQIRGAFQVATGLDFEKDLLGNLTGEIVSADYTPAGAVWTLGTRDDVRTRHLVERLDGALGGALAGLSQALEPSGWRVAHSTDTIAGRPAFLYHVAVPKEQTAETGLESMDAILTSMPGALVLALGRKAVEIVQRSAERPETIFLSRLATPEARAAFEGEAPLVSWALVENPLAVPSARRQYESFIRKTGALHPDLPQGLYELLALTDLLYDGTLALDVGADRVGLMFQVTLL